MGIFGNLGETFTGLSNALTQLVYRPFHEENIVLGLAKGSAIFVKQSISSLYGSVGSILDSFKRAAVYVSSGRANNQL